jgi:hypothetical protein
MQIAGSEVMSEVTGQKSECRTGGTECRKRIADCRLLFAEWGPGKTTAGGYFLNRGRRVGTAFR